MQDETATLQADGLADDVASFVPSVGALVAEIEAAYARLGHTLGWRFLMGPAATLSPASRVALITLNPGGSSRPADHAEASCEYGSAYWTESWAGSPRGQAPLQRQIQALLGGLARELGTATSVREWTDRNVVTAHFIPFRSPSIAALPRSAESIAFARTLWHRILADWTPRTIVTIDGTTFSEITSILRSRPGAKIDAAQVLPTGWGNVSAEIMRIRGPHGMSTVGRLPHLSRFALFGRRESAEHVSDWLRALVAPATGGEQ
jgi:hypothetical protein